MVARQQRRFDVAPTWTRAGHALRAGLVDEILLVVWPVVLGAGKPALPADIRLDLELLDERRFASGAVHLAYRVRH